MQDSFTLGACKGGLVITCRLYKLVTIVMLQKATKPKDLVWSARREDAPSWKPLGKLFFSSLFSPLNCMLKLTWLCTCFHTHLTSLSLTLVAVRS